MDNNDEILQNLIKRIYHLEQEVIRLGGEPYKKENASIPKVNEPVVKVKEQLPKEQAVAVTDTTTSKTSNKPVNKKSNVENKIGKNGMAIVASILIFFSLVLFAGIAFSYLSDIAKVVIMYLISIAIAAFGIVKTTKLDMEKNARFKTFYTTIAACGIGAVYITDLVAYFGFKCLPLIPFIIMLVIWIVITMYLSYKCSTIFAYICNIGLIIATVLTAVQFNSSIVAFILYTICLAALYMILRQENFNKDSFFFIQYPVVFILLSCAVETGALSYTIFIVLLVSVFVLANLIYRIEKKHIGTNVAVVVLNIAAFIRMCIGLDGNAMKYVVIGLIIGMMVMYFVRYYAENRILFYIVYAITYVSAVFVFLTTDMYITIALTPFILLLIAGFAKKDMWIRLGGYFAVITSYMIHMDFYESWGVFIIYLIILMAAGAAVVFISYSMVDKYVITAILSIVLFIAIDVLDFNICISFVSFGIMAFITNSEAYGRNLESKSEELISKIIGYIFSGCVILAGLSCSFNKNITPDLYQVIIIMLITLAVSCINTVKLFNIGIPEMLAGFYICIKFSLWIYTVLHRLEAASYVLSVVGIVVAIICIVLGFKFRQKSFRLYGLIISMVSVIKLILFDISYDSNILRPVGFFVAGVLCFAISFIYSKLEKTIAVEQEENS